jgi:hypothetical protein
VGYNIYQDGKKIGFTPLRSFTVERFRKSSVYGVKAIDLHGNESEAAE